MDHRSSTRTKALGQTFVGWGTATAAPRALGSTSLEHVEQTAANLNTFFGEAAAKRGLEALRPQPRDDEITKPSTPTTCTATARERARSAPGRSSPQQTDPKLVSFEVDVV